MPHQSAPPAAWVAQRPLMARTPARPDGATLNPPAPAAGGVSFWLGGRLLLAPPLCWGAGGRGARRPPPPPPPFCGGRTIRPPITKRALAAWAPATSLTDPLTSPRGHWLLR